MSLEKWGVSITSDEVKSYRDKHELPLMVAKKAIIQQKKLEVLSEIRKSKDIDLQIDFILDIIDDMVKTNKT